MIVFGIIATAMTMLNCGARADLALSYYGGTSEQTGTASLLAMTSLQERTPDILLTGITMQTGVSVLTSGTVTPFSLSIGQGPTATASFKLGTDPSTDPLTVTFNNINVNNSGSLIAEIQSHDANVIVQLSSLTLTDITTGQQISANSIVADGADPVKQIQGINFTGLVASDQYQLTGNQEFFSRSGTLPGTGASVSFSEPMSSIPEAGTLFGALLLLGVISVRRRPFALIP